MSLEVVRPEVVVIGGGPSGLATAAALAGRDVLVIEREGELGGIPRHCHHPGFGIRDLHRSLSGPAYAARLAERARAGGARVWTRAMVTALGPDRTLAVTTPQGLRRVEPRVVVLATGARERPRPARLIAGDRPDGVYTTGQLQQLVHLRHRSVGERAVVVGAELVSFSAVLTLRAAGCETVLMTSAYARAESYRLLGVAGSALLRAPVATRTRLVRIEGRERVRSVVLRDERTGVDRRVECDTVILTGDWVPDHELARRAGLEIDPGSLGPVVDMGLRTSTPGVFAVGNLVHPVDTADVAALDGAHVATAVMAYLRGGRDASGTKGVRVLAGESLRWLAPGMLRAADPAPARRRLLAWTDISTLRPTVEVRQDGALLTARRLAWPAAPGRVFRMPSSVLDGVDPAGGAVTVSVR